MSDATLPKPDNAPDVLALNEWCKPDFKVWLFLHKETGSPLAVRLDKNKPTLVLLAWSSKAKADKWLRKDKNARKAKLIPWTMSQVLAWCKKNGVMEMLPDLENWQNSSVATFMMPTLEAVFLSQQSPNN